MPKSNYSLESALTLIVSELPFPRQQFGGKVIIGNSDHYAEVTLSIHGTDGGPGMLGQFKYVLVKYFAGSHLSNTFAFNLADPKYKPEGVNSPSSGGYFWGSIQDFYHYEPDLSVVAQDLTSVLTFLGFSPTRREGKLTDTTLDDLSCIQQAK